MRSKLLLRLTVDRIAACRALNRLNQHPVEPQFAPQRARSLAKSLDLTVVMLDPLAVDLVAELYRFALALLAANSIEDQP